jgi:membrane dipeptidase
VDAAAAAELHRKAIVVDGHVHITNAVLTQGIDPWQEQATGTFDYARARRGGLDVVVDHLFVEDGYTAYNYTVKQAVRLIETAHRVRDQVTHPRRA